MSKSKLKKVGEIHAQFITDHVHICETVDGEFMVLVNGLQWGGKRDLSGAGDATFKTIAEAREAYCTESDY